MVLNLIAHEIGIHVMRIYAVLAFTLLIESGCSTLESSTYQNRSTGSGNDVIATGRAAEAAASANTSHNCPTCVSNENAKGSVSAPNQRKRRAEESTNRIVTSAGDTLSSEISQGVNQAIRDMFD